MRLQPHNFAPHDPARRTALARGAGWIGLLLVSGWLAPARVLAAGSRAAFDARNMKNALAALGAQDAQASTAIEIVAPQVADDGAVVPIEVKSREPGTRAIAILVDRNPTMLVARFEIPPGTVPRVGTRIRMAEKANVIVLAQTDAGFRRASVEVDVTIGGCG